MKQIATYKNGNYNVILFSDGTKIRFNRLDSLTPDFAESMDVTITEKCDGKCPFCYLDCKETGKHADLNQPFFDTLHAGTELALNGNDMSHPDLESFLVRMRNKGVFCNITLNQKHFMKYYNTLIYYQNRQLINGVGVSLVEVNDELIEKLNFVQNTVLHTIDGLLKKNDIESLSNHNIRLLILGYKILGRGNSFYNTHKIEIEENISFLREHILEYRDKFEVISFDNLALEHFDMKSKFNEDEWSSMYMGDEGSYTFYIDAVNKKFSVSSLDTRQFDVLDNVDDMFQHVRKIAGKL